MHKHEDKILNSTNREHTTKVRAGQKHKDVANGIRAWTTEADFLCSNPRMTTLAVQICG